MASSAGSIAAKLPQSGASPAALFPQR
jgi:hypothetical protein